MWSSDYALEYQRWKLEEGETEVERRGKITRDGRVVVHSPFTKTIRTRDSEVTKLRRINRETFRPKESLVI